jgi:hypothetical protein
MVTGTKQTKRISLKLRREDTIDIICFNCFHFDTMRIGGCKAFPGQIPNNILNGQSDHHQPVKGQRGEFVFTPIMTPSKMWGRLERTNRALKRAGKNPIIENWT